MDNNHIADRQKLKSIIHYICSKYNGNNKLGAVKLNKIIWFFDKFWFKQHYQSATSISHYCRKQKGPMIPDFYAIIKELETEGKITTTPIAPLSFNHPKYNSIQPLGDDSFLLEEQLALLNEIADIIVNELSASEASDLSHKNCWNSFADGQFIPIEAVLWDDNDDEEASKPSAEMIAWVEDNKEILLEEMRLDDVKHG